MIGSGARSLRSVLLLGVATVVLASAVAFGAPGTDIVGSDASVGDGSERTFDDLAASSPAASNTSGDSLAGRPVSSDSPTVASQDVAVTTGETSPSLAAEWTTTTGNPQHSAPTVGAEHVYVGSGGGEFYALSETDGTVEWTHATDSAIVSSPTVTGGTVTSGPTTAAC